jgi:hypothetical protein
MSDSIERQYRPNIPEMVKRMTARGLSIPALANLAEINAKTLRRMLDPDDERRHFLATYKALARHLGLRDDQVAVLIQDFEPDPIPDNPERDNLGATRDLDFESADLTEAAYELAAFFQRFLDKKHKIFVISIGPGSVAIEFNIDDEAIVRIVRGFALGDLIPLQVTSLTVNPKNFVDDEPLEQEPDFSDPAALDELSDRLFNEPPFHPKKPPTRPTVPKRQKPPLQEAIQSLPLSSTEVDGQLVLRRATPTHKLAPI